MTNWIGVDFDGTLVEYHEHDWMAGGEVTIGKPVSKMVDLVKNLIKEGFEVRIFTARCSGPDHLVHKAMIAIRKWCEEHLGQELKITNVKDFDMIRLYDDRAIQVEFNTGKLVGID